MSQAVDAMMAMYKPVVEDHQFGCWTITATKCHILASEGPERQKYAVAVLVVLCHCWFYHMSTFITNVGCDVDIA